MRLSKSIKIIVIVLSVILLLSACNSGSSKEVSECKEIAEHYQNKLSSKSIDKDIKLKFYLHDDDTNSFFIERYHPEWSKTSYFMWNRETGRDKSFDSLKQSTKELVSKYKNEGELIYEATIDYANKED